MCVAGNLINSYIVKESIVEILQRLEYTPGKTDTSLANIAELIRRVYHKITLELGKTPFDKPIAGLIITGYCRVNKQVKFYKFETFINAEVTTACTEILQQDGMEFIGSGSKAAEIIRQSNPETKCLHIVREVIKDKSEKEVGGSLQYGQIQNQNFVIYGVEEIEEEDMGYLVVKQQLRGLSMQKEELEHNEGDFKIALDFYQPFKNEANSYLRGKSKGE